MTLLVVVVMGYGRFDYGTWLPFVLAAMAILAGIAYLTPPVAGAALLAGAVGVAAMLLWPGIRAPIPSNLLAPVVARYDRTQTEIAVFENKDTLNVTVLISFIRKGAVYGDQSFE